ncbi:hypothetical protein LEP3755_56260 [Leptolyngbya sp. NIES-3755]|nr:hypothetical protein LEP3755_56260 [Leptolyngbya sp. NIES-3755]
MFDPRESLSGNVVSITVRGEAATSTGINPHVPPRRWEAWNGEAWEPILRTEEDDRTQGFSFSDLSQQRPNTVQTADVVLHLPKQFPVSQFQSYRGHWLRCVCVSTNGEQPDYRRSPQVLGLSVQSIGGTISASQCSRIEDEILGTSDGTAGQTFQLFGAPVLSRTEGEYLQVIPPNSLPQTWQEVPDFSASDAHDRHYVIDSLTGAVQFGPLVREPMQLRQEMHDRNQIQSQKRGTAVTSPTELETLERQYGAIPPRGSTIRMLSYRTGGGQQGNVQREMLRVLKTAVPFVASVINHEPAQNGTDAESLEHAAIRVPKLLRSNNRAVTPEDFETLTLQAGGVARCRCLPASHNQEAGTVRLLIVPKVNLNSIDDSSGIHPDQLVIRSSLREQILAYLNERKLLGVQIQLDTPEYVGVSVRVEVGVDPVYSNPQARETILRQLRSSLYRFLNPVIGGLDGMGWEFGRPLYPSDIVALFQQVQGVRYLGAVQLFELRYQATGWVRNPSPQSVINPGALGLICSWNDRQLRANHSINLIA